MPLVRGLRVLPSKIETFNVELCKCSFVLASCSLPVVSYACNTSMYTVRCIGTTRKLSCIVSLFLALGMSSVVPTHSSSA